MRHSLIQIKTVMIWQSSQNWTLTKQKNLFVRKQNHTKYTSHSTPTNQVWCMIINLIQIYAHTIRTHFTFLVYYVHAQAQCLCLALRNKTEPSQTSSQTLTNIMYTDQYGEPYTNNWKLEVAEILWRKKHVFPFFLLKKIQSFYFFAYPDCQTTVYCQTQVSKIPVFLSFELYIPSN